MERLGVAEARFFDARDETRAGAFRVLGHRIAALCAGEGLARAVSATARSSRDREPAGHASVEALVSAAQDEAGDFVLAVLECAGRIVLVARGGYGATLRRPGIELAFSGGSVRPWHLAAYDDLQGLMLHRGVAGDGADLERVDARDLGVVGGVARVAVVAGTNRWTPPPPDAGRWDETVGDTLRIGSPGARSALAGMRPARPPATPVRLRIGATEVALETTVVLGRRPERPRGAETVALVPVPSPNRTVSASHLMLARSAAGVVATDLRSTNGTRVHPPGSGVRRMRPGESIVVPPGTRIDIGDGNIVEILPVQTHSAGRTGPEESR